MITTIIAVAIGAGLGVGLVIASALLRIADALESREAERKAA